MHLSGPGPKHSNRKMKSGGGQVGDNEELIDNDFNKRNRTAQVEDTEKSEARTRTTI